MIIWYDNFMKRYEIMFLFSNSPKQLDCDAKK